MHSQQLKNGGPEVGELSSVDLRDYVRAIRRRWSTVVVCMVLGVAGAVAYSKGTPPSYEATAQVVLPQGGQAGATTPTPSVLNEDLVAEQSVATSENVARRAAHVLGLKTSLARFLASVPSHLSVLVPTGSDALQITWRADSVDKARQGANAFARAYLNYKWYEVSNVRYRLQQRVSATNPSSLVNQIVRKGDAWRANKGSTRFKLGTQLTLLRHEEAAVIGQLDTLPTSVASIGTVIPAWNVHRSGLGKSSLAGLGLLCGLLLGVIIVVIRDLRDHSIRGPEQLEDELDAPVVAFLPAPPGGGMRGRSAAKATTPGQQRTSPITVVGQPDGASAQAFRALRATLVAAGVGRASKVLLVVNGDPVDSSSRLVTELGLAMAESGRNTLLVGADLRDSTLAQIFGIPATSGLNNILANTAGIEDGIRSVQACAGKRLPPFVAERLHVLPAGPMLVRPLSLLDSDVMVSLLAKASDTYDVVLLDSPAKELLESIVPLARVVDGTLVVAGKERTTVEMVRAIRQRLAQARGNVIGAVLEVPAGTERTASTTVARPAAPAKDHFEDAVGAKLQAVPPPQKGFAATGKGPQRGAGI